MSLFLRFIQFLAKTARLLGWGIEQTAKPITGKEIPFPSYSPTAASISETVKIL
jgi:hypothetical protein